ncbi:MULTISPECIES: class I SAM-dependent methyltransferase [unclassified Acidiphilium]|uniref:class I SAM-dependent methyltransferase n=1 Tax=unclassified Acidiphilium TaxID=2617493 RepID=UPI000BCA4719|nr:MULTISPECIES: class I SAM-dependent methyltransferase [unclassified Acidiphilium]OYV55483.1 MAG: SAM-dependent methyltransferase [Acidiphilium sp. 20-67-58]HQT61689.1 class I SAM-dependent methyltransferase [Acidiphilium sp.]
MTTTPLQPATAPAIRVHWPDAPAAPQDLVCPNCGAEGPKPRLLDVAWTAPKLPRGDRKPVFACPACTARFYPPLRVPNYGDPDVMDWGWHQFHIQHGAGLVAITRLLGRIARPAGTRCLEIGCGYGFGLDFARHAMGWTCLGIDPSPMAHVGAADLGLDIIDGYFPDALPDAKPWDVIAATEVIEHVQCPAALIAELRARLAPDGILLLTTPDGAAIDRATPETDLAQLLAPGIHMVFQTEASLRRLLEAAGFANVRVAREGLTLVAYAGATRGALAEDDAAQRPRFRAWLADRARALDPASDPGLGFAARALFEAAIDLDWPAAAAARSHLWPAIRARYGFEPDTLETIPADWMSLPLARLNEVMPLNLGMILHAEASRLRADRATRPRAGAVFALAGDAAAALHEALARLTLNDALATQLAFRAAAEAALEAARVAAPETPGRFAVLATRDAPETERRDVLWRGVIELVNAGAPERARALMQEEGLTEPTSDLPAATRQDALIVLGQLALGPGGDPHRAIALADRLGADTPSSPGAPFLLGAIVRLSNDGEETSLVPLLHRAAQLCAGRTDALGTDASNALAGAIERHADPVEIPLLLRPLRIDPRRRVEAVLTAFTRLVAAARHEEAVAMADAENIVSHAVARDDAIGRDTRRALALLDLATGDPADIPSRLSGLALDHATQREMVIDGFCRLVNNGRYADAARYAETSGVETLAATGDPADPTRIAAVSALAILDLVTGDPAHAPARIAAVPVSPERRRQITLGAFVTLVNRARYDEAVTIAESAPVTTWAAIDDADGHDAAIALIALTLVAGDPVMLPALLEGLPHLDHAARGDALVQGALRLLHLNRPDEASSLIAPVDEAALAPPARIELLAARAGCAAATGDIGNVILLLERLEAEGAPADRIAGLALGTFTQAVNAGDFAAASLLRRRIEPAFAGFTPATNETLRGAGFALGLLELQEPARPHRAELAFAAVRRGFAADLAAGEAAPLLFWEALRGEMIALHRTGRAAEATALGRAMLTRYDGAPDSLRTELAAPAP